jgi:hypothetical protein
VIHTGGDIYKQHTTYLKVANGVLKVRGFGRTKREGGILAEQSALEHGGGDGNDDRVVLAAHQEFLH